ncbi:hypothetical protein [Actinoplanes awajinensis]|uniref:hypothetical protein n=1 Tax=Actinoplanes awajinensis TaxID=135946 RepID=UPI001E289227|nr:hypothetical protein [Actinoplanes awajinensis]
MVTLFALNKAADSAQAIYSNNVANVSQVGQIEAAFALARLHLATSAIAPDDATSDKYHTAYTEDLTALDQAIFTYRDGTFAADASAAAATARSTATSSRTLSISLLSIGLLLALGLGVVVAGAIVRSLAGASEELSSVSSQIAASAQKTSAQAQTVSAAAEEFSRSVDTVSAGGEQMGASIREISQNASEAAQAAGEAVGLAASNGSRRSRPTPAGR